MGVKREVAQYTKERIVLIEQMLAENPYRTLQEIGDEFGITRERTRQILKKHGLDKLRKKKKSACPKGHEYTEAQKRAPSWYSRNRCLICHPVAYGRYVDKDGYIKPTMVTKPCNKCNNPITRSMATTIRLMNNPNYTTNNWYCNKKCFNEHQVDIKWWSNSPIHRDNCEKDNHEHYNS